MKSIMKKSVILTGILLICGMTLMAFSQSGFATVYKTVKNEGRYSTITYPTIYEKDFTRIVLGGDAAHAIYDRMQILERENRRTRDGRVVDMLKASPDGRILCIKKLVNNEPYYPQDPYECDLDLDSTSGSIPQTWLNLYK